MAGTNANLTSNMHRLYSGTEFEKEQRHQNTELQFPTAEAKAAHFEPNGVHRLAYKNKTKQKTTQFVFQKYIKLGMKFSPFTNT